LRQTQTGKQCRFQHAPAGRAGAHHHAAYRLTDCRQIVGTIDIDKFQPKLARPFLFITDSTVVLNASTLILSAATPVMYAANLELESTYGQIVFPWTHWNFHI